VTREKVIDSGENRIALVRRELGGLSQPKFAAAIGMPLHKVKDAESGKVKISTELARGIEERFGYLFRWVLTGEGPKRKGEGDAYTEGSLAETEKGSYVAPSVFEPVAITPVEQRVLQRAIELVETAASGATPEAKAQAIVAILAALEVVRKKDTE
jgi:transcriptional regulator with XRE-family HTH domain